MIWHLVQAVIAASSAVAIVLTFAKHGRVAKAGAIVGLASQPFWLYSTFVTGAWGMFVAAVLWFFAWSWICWKTWVEPREAA